MAEKSAGQMMAEGFLRAIPWAIVFAVTVVITLKISMVMLGQEVKEAIDFTAKTAVNTSMDAIVNSGAYPKIKQNTKEAIEYTVQTVDTALVATYVKPVKAKK